MVSATLLHEFGILRIQCYRFPFSCQFLFLSVFHHLHALIHFLNNQKAKSSKQQKWYLYELLQSTKRSAEKGRFDHSFGFSCKCKVSKKECMCISMGSADGRQRKFINATNWIVRIRSTRSFFDLRCDRARGINTESFRFPASCILHFKVPRFVSCFPRCLSCIRFPVSRCHIPGSSSLVSRFHTPG